MREIETRTGLRLLIRRPRVTDDGYVLRSALKTIRSGRGYRDMPPEMFFDTVGELVRDRWRDDLRLQAVACLPSDEDFIVGFLIGDPAVPLLDYLHVRGGFRGQGVATALMEEVLGIDRDTHAYITFATDDYHTRRSWARLLPVGGNKKDD